MKALFDFIPAYCPNCGRNLGEGFKNRYALEDYHAQAGHTCDCGMKFQYAPDLEQPKSKGKPRGAQTAEEVTE